MDDSKICFKCGIIKSLDMFYKHSQMADGRLNKCKECNKKDVRENRVKNIDYYREYDAIRFQNDEKVKARHIRYQKTDAGKDSSNTSKRRLSEKNLIKRSASYIVNNAVRDGKLIKPSNCENCGFLHDRIHGHHNDYSYPMVVRWLCLKCHTAWHKENGEGANG